MGTGIPASPSQNQLWDNLKAITQPCREPFALVNAEPRRAPNKLVALACGRLERAGFRVGAAALRFRAFRQRSRRSATGLGWLNKSPPTSRENIRFLIAIFDGHKPRKT